MNPLDDPRVQVDSYVVYPTGYADLVHSDKDAWCLTVTNGHAYGWSIRRGLSMTGPMAMNRHGKWIMESRGSDRNKPRRWSLEEALTIALRHVDTQRIARRTAQEASDEVAARLTDERRVEAL